MKKILSIQHLFKIVEDFPLTALRPTQYSATNEDEDFSELKSRIQQKQKQA